MGGGKDYLRYGVTKRQGSTELSMGYYRTPSKSTGVKDVAKVEVRHIDNSTGTYISHEIVVDHADARPNIKDKGTRFGKLYEFKP